MNIKIVKNYISFFGILVGILAVGFFVATPTVQAVCDEDLGPTIATTMPSELTSDSATLNAYFSARDACFTDFNRPQVVFEFGDSLDLDSQSSPISIMMGASSVSIEIKDLDAGETYYYRAVMYYGNSIVKGDKVKFTTSKTSTTTHQGLDVTESNNVINASNSNSQNSNTNTNSNSNTSNSNSTSNVSNDDRNASDSNGTASLSITNDRDVIRNGEYVTYEVSYANLKNNRELEDAVLVVTLPEGMQYVSGSDGVSYSENRNGVVVNLRDIKVSESATYSITTKVRSIKLDQAIAEAKLTYRDVDTRSRETLTAYDIDEVDASTDSALGASVFSSGFFPGNTFGWLIVALLLIAIIYLVRVHLWKYYWSDNRPKKPETVQEHSIGEAPRYQPRA